MSMFPSSPQFPLSGSLMQDSPPPSHPLKAVPIAVADEGDSESEDDDLKPRGNGQQHEELRARLGMESTKVLSLLTPAAMAQWAERQAHRMCCPWRRGQRPCLCNLLVCCLEPELSRVAKRPFLWYTQPCLGVRSLLTSWEVSGQNTPVVMQ